MADEPTVEASLPELPVILDGRTVVLLASTNLGDGEPKDSARTPSDQQVAAALATIEANDALSWASAHTRFVRANQTDDGLIVRVDFSCSSPALQDPQEAVAEIQSILSIDGGGDCYGRANFTADGELISWRTNGES